MAQTAVNLPPTPERTPPDIRPADGTALRNLIAHTKVSRADAEYVRDTEGVDGLFRLFADRVRNNLDSWLACGDYSDRPFTAAEVLAELAADGDLDAETAVRVLAAKEQ